LVSHAGVDGVHQRQAIAGLHQAEHELARNAPGLLVDAVGANVVLEFGITVDAHGGQVVEDDREFLVDQRTDEFA
jgi:hypothetical protein